MHRNGSVLRLIRQQKFRARETDPGASRPCELMLAAPPPKRVVSPALAPGNLQQQINYKGILWY